MFGSSLEVELDTDLRIAARRLDGTRLPFDQLSTGAREQLGILSRLACASIVAGEDGAPVILDDTLGWTDPQRLTQMAAAIGIAGRTCQIILLTCTPGRFAHVGAATVVRLPGSGPALAAAPSSA
ncbi:MAG: ATP-binding protein [Actinomycetota bacterium]